MSMTKADSAEIFVGFDKDISDEVIVKADGKYLGTAEQVLQFVGLGMVECERERAMPLLDWLTQLRAG